MCEIYEPYFDRSNLFIVPGNHDVNRTLITEDQNDWIEKQVDSNNIINLLNNTPLMWSRIMERLKDYRDFVEEIGCNHLLSDPQRLTFTAKRFINGVSVGITGLNSVWSCSKEGQKGKIWSGGLWQIYKSVPLIKECDVKIAIIHHPTGWFVEQEDQEISRLLQLEYDFCLHGHEHRGWVEKVNNHIRIASSACYNRHDKENGYCYTNINVKKRTGVVYLRQFDSIGLGWTPRIISRITDENGSIPFDFSKEIRKTSAHTKREKVRRAVPKMIVSGNITQNTLKDLFDISSSYNMKLTIKLVRGNNISTEIVPSGVQEKDLPKVISEIAKLFESNNQIVNEVFELKDQGLLRSNQDDDLIFLKIGGTLITDRDKPKTPLLDNIHSIANQIAAAYKENPKLKILLGHGAGTYGHILAHKYHIRNGVTSPDGWNGFHGTWYEASELNRIFVEALREASLPAITIEPLSSIITKNREVISWDIKPIKAALTNNFLPVIYGNVIFDEKIGGTVLSTEEMFLHLSTLLRPKRILLAGIEQGVWADFPSRNQIVSKISKKEELDNLENLYGNDLTGGIVGKVNIFYNLCANIPGLSVFIFSGKSNDSIKNALIDKINLSGTLITS